MSDQSEPVAASLRTLGGKLAMQLGWAATAFALLLYLLAQTVEMPTLGSVAVAFRSSGSGQLLLAGLLTALSYLSIALYDPVALSAMGRGMRLRDGLCAGLAATGIGQTIGFGAVTGAFVRWRMLRRPDFGLQQAVFLSVRVTAGFFLGGSVLLAVLVLTNPMAIVPFSMTVPTVFAAALLLGGVAYLAARGGRFRLAGFSVSVPSRKVLLCQIGLAIGDLVPAAAVFFILLPQAYAPDFSTVLAVYVGAMYLGLAANTPGGLGAFELACLTLLPDIPTADMLSTLVLYRLIYNGGPFVLALVLLGRHEFSAKVRADHNAARLPQVFSLPEVRGEILRINKTQLFAEAGLALQGDKAFLVAHDSAYMMFSDASTYQIAMGDPLGDPASFPALLDRFEARARSFRRKPVIYKAREDMRPKYESRGWRSLPIGQEAVVKLSDYTLQKPAMRELRRKLRKAEKAGVRVICHPAGTAPYARLQGISDVWLMAKAGDESRFSIGHFAPEYLDHALVFEARNNKKTIAFLTVWTESNGCEWSLDLMRGLPDAPDGVMHSLVHAAITAAQKQNVENFNLCFVPFWVRPNASRWSHFLLWMFHNASALQEARGLYRFKNSFRPAWHQRYLVTPSRLPIGAVLAVRKLVRGN